MIKIAVLVAVGIIILFVVLQKLSNKTYKPTRNEIAEKLRATLNGGISYIEFDELISVKIAYDQSLEEIRRKFIDIIDDTRNINQPHTKTKTIDLSDAGKIRVEELIKEMELST